VITSGAFGLDEGTQVKVGPAEDNDKKSDDEKKPGSGKSGKEE